MAWACQTPSCPLEKDESCVSDSGRHWRDRHPAWGGACPPAPRRTERSEDDPRMPRCEWSCCGCRAASVGRAGRGPLGRDMTRLLDAAEASSLVQEDGVKRIR